MMMALMKDVSFKGNVETKTLLLNEENLKKNIWISSLNFDIDYINVKIVGIYLTNKIALFCQECTVLIPIQLFLPGNCTEKIKCRRKTWLDLML